MKKLTSMLLVLAMLLSCALMPSCGKEGDKELDCADEPENTDGKTEDTDTHGYSYEDREGEMKVTLSEEKPTLPDDAFSLCDGTTFTVFAPYPYGIDVYVREAQNGEPLNDAIYDRNLAMTDTLGVTVNCVDFNYYTHNQAEKIIDSVLAGDHSFDVAAIHSTSACASLIVADAVLPFESLEYCDLSKPWWDKGFQQNCSLLGNDYFAISSACHRYYTDCSCLLFNKDLAEEHGLPNLYELVRKGEWTVDKLTELTKNFSQDLNGDGMYDENDLVAIVSNNHSHINTWYGAFRQSTVERGENDEPTTVAGSQRMATVVEKLNTLFHSGRRGFIYDMYDSTTVSAARDAFAEGRVLFFCGVLSDPIKLREYDINFGILPFPKLNSEQESYGSWVDPWHLAFCVPADCPDPEKLSVILEQFSYLLYNLIYPAIVEKTIFGVGTRDLDSLEMLEEYIFPYVYYDFGFIFDSWGTGYGSLLRTLVPENSTDIASYLAERKNSAESHYAEIYDALVK